MRQVLRAGALGRPRGMGWRGRREGGLGWGTHVNPWLIHVNVWQKLLQYCKVIILQLIKIKINGKKKRTLRTPDSSVGKESACNAGDPGSIPELGRSLGEGKGYPLQYSGLENSMDFIYSPLGGKELDTTERLSLHFISVITLNVNRLNSPTKRH